MAGWRLRLATAADADFEFELFARTRGAEFASLGWPEPQLQALLRMQYRARESAYSQQFAHAQTFIVCRADAGQAQPVGRVVLTGSAGLLHIVDIALRPECCGHGIGSALLRTLQQRAALLGQRIELQVALDNPARRLYLRLGFVDMQVRGQHQAMQWRPERAPQSLLNESPAQAEPVAPQPGSSESRAAH